MVNFTLLAIIGGVAAFWSQVRSLAAGITSLFVGKMSCEHWKTGYIVQHFVFQKCRTLMMADVESYASYGYNKKKKKRQYNGLFMTGSNGMMFFYGWNPAILKSSSEANRNFTVYYLRGLFPIAKFFADCTDNFNDFLTSTGVSRYKTERLVGERSNLSLSTKEDNGRPEVSSEEVLGYETIRAISSRGVNCDVSDLISMSTRSCESKFSSVHEWVINDLEVFFSAKNWYEKHGMPWRRGYLLHGPPGTGKTTIARIVGKQYNMPLLSFDMASMTNSTFTSFWQSVSMRTPCVVLFEDFDSVFHGRKNLTDTQQSKGVTFDALLNAIDGAEMFEGVVVIFTANDVSSVDKALYDRPGRIDKIIEMPMLKEEEAKALISHYGNPFSEEEYSAVIGEVRKGNMSAAKMAEACRNAALSNMYKTPNKDPEKAA